INDYKFLMHTWSLSVEIQYYLIAPVLLYILVKLKNTLSKKACFAACLVIALISGLSQALENNTNIYFYYFPFRIWQFILGTAAFLLYDFSTHQGFIILKGNDIDDTNADITLGKTAGPLFVTIYMLCIQINDYKFLMHTWSLSVEIQYYLIAPVLLYILVKLKNTLSKKSLFRCLLGYCVDFWTFSGFGKQYKYLFLLFPFRIWQFILGTAAFCY
uniref:Acyltransferase n=1 Tax=Ditylenchus dipsaci TaxID=166011 RepID=A0A915EBN2_9BILA